MSDRTFLYDTYGIEKPFKFEGIENEFRIGDKEGRLEVKVQGEWNRCQELFLDSLFGVFCSKGIIKTEPVYKEEKIDSEYDRAMNALRFFDGLYMGLFNSVDYNEDIYIEYYNQFCLEKLSLSLWNMGTFPGGKPEKVKDLVTFSQGYQRGNIRSEEVTDMMKMCGKNGLKMRWVDFREKKAKELKREKEYGKV